MYLDASTTLTTLAVGIGSVMAVATALVMGGLTSQIGLGWGVRKFKKYVTGRKF